MNSFRELAKTRRTIRRFRQEPLDRELLVELVDVARHAPSANNRQPLRYLLVTDPELVAGVFPHTAWAGLIRPRRNPAPDQRPVAWIVVLVDSKVRDSWWERDVGAAVHAILLAAWERGVGTAWLGAVDREGLRATLGVPERYIVADVVALGYPAEEPLAEDLAADVEVDDDSAVRYFLDDDDRLHVPKRPLAHVLFENRPPPA